MSGWFVYILKSTVNGKLYTGMTNDLQKRLKKHNTGRGARFTRFGGPWEIAYSEPCESKSAALKREYAIKQKSRAAKLAMIATTPASSR